MKYTKIIGTGSYLPSLVFTNEDWEKRVETSHQWIVDRTGIHSRHIASADETASHMGTEAAKLALEMAGIKAEELDLIIVSTGAPDQIFPATACLIQKKLGAGTCGAFDVQAACSGFIYGLSIADQFIRTGQAKKILLVCTELMSRLINWSDRETCVLFGDGAGAVVLSASDTPGIVGTKLYANGNYDHILNVGNSQLQRHAQGGDPIYAQPSEEVYPYIFMQGRAVFRVAVTVLGQMVNDMIVEHGLDAAEIDWLIPHQANIRIIEATAQKLGMPMSKVICTVQTHANTSSASIPLALDTAVRDGRVKPNQRLLLEAVGAGMTWGSAFIQF
jgi:3-oxoacyl-[acyl-carrier-protein] synthase-3